MSDLGFLRTALVSPSLKVCDVSYNVERLITASKEAASEGAALIVFPSLCITGATAGDLLFNSSVLEAARRGISKICEEKIDALLVISSPLEYSTLLYECALFILRGEILAVSPLRVLLPGGKNKCEVNENFDKDETIYISKAFPRVPFGKIILKNEEGFPFSLAAKSARIKNVCIEIEQDAVKERAGLSEEIACALSFRSRKAACASVYAGAGVGETTSNGVYSGRRAVYECGEKLCEAPLFSEEILYADIDAELLLKEKMRRGVQKENKDEERVVHFSLTRKEKQAKDLRRLLSPHPFFPEDKEEKAAFMDYVFTLTSRTLSERLLRIRAKGAVIALSGGLDSTLALIIASRALQLASLPPSALLAVTMPCFGSSSRTKNNAALLASLYESEFMCVDIRQAVMQHFSDISHDPDEHDVTYENSQARERTQVLLDLANKHGYLALGTGDMSEAALGWCTFGGDNISMYNVNGSLPKTLVREMVRREANKRGGEVQKVLEDILATPVSPELLPLKAGEKESAQKSEEILGSYELHDFFLYYFLRYGFSARKILYLAEASKLDFSREEMKRVMKIFLRRFISSSFKRGVGADFPSVYPFSLSQTDFSMPNDISSSLWDEETNSL